MLRIFLIGLILLFSFNTFACWKVEGTLTIKEESWKFQQRCDQNKEYIFPLGPFILQLILKSDKKEHLLSYVVREKKGLELNLVTQGEEIIKVKEEQEIFAQGAQGRPNSKITIKLIHI